MTQIRASQAVLTRVHCQALGVQHKYSDTATDPGGHQKAIRGAETRGSRHTILSGVHDVPRAVPPGPICRANIRLTALTPVRAHNQTGCRVYCARRTRRRQWQCTSLAVLARRRTEVSNSVCPQCHNIAHLHAEGEGTVCMDNCCTACAACRGDVGRDFAAARVRVAVSDVPSPESNGDQSTLVFACHCLIMR